jgi:hypothetical protein
MNAMISRSFPTVLWHESLVGSFPIQVGVKKVWKFSLGVDSESNASLPPGKTSQ